MKTSSSFVFKCSQCIRSTLLALVWFSMGTICVFADPTVTIDQPANGASFAGPTSVTIEATVIDVLSALRQAAGLGERASAPA